jgi:hypothetical protein
MPKPRTFRTIHVQEIGERAPSTTITAKQVKKEGIFTKTQNHPYYYYYKAGKEGGAGVMQHGAG